MPAAACVVLVVVGLAVFAAAERRRRPRWAFIGKFLASFGFLALGWSRLRTGSTADAFFVLGLALCLAGDLLLLARRLFTAGLAAFLLGHLAYLAAFHALVPARAWPFPLAAPAVSASVLVAGWLWPRLGRLRPAVFAYIAAITAMVWGALSCAAAGALPAAAAVGAVLFYVSDLAVARQRFVAPSFPVRVLGLVAYYLGQLLLAGAVGATDQ